MSSHPLEHEVLLSVYGIYKTISRGYPQAYEKTIVAVVLTVYEFIRNIFVVSNPATTNDSFAVHALPMLSLFGSVAGTIILMIMAIDVFFLVKRQYD